MNTQNLAEAWLGETIYIFSDVPAEKIPSDIYLRKFQYVSIITNLPSWYGARTGHYRDALKSISPQEQGDITALKFPLSINIDELFFTASDGTDYLIKINKERSIPYHRLFPIYAEITSDEILKAYSKANNITGDSLYPHQGPQTVKAIKLARDFGIEPIKQSIYWFHECGEPYEFDRGGEYCFENLVFKNNIAPPMVYCNAKPHNGCSYAPQRNFLEEVNKKAPPGTIAWCADEPYDPSIPRDTKGMSIPDAIERIRYVKKHAPNLTCAISGSLKTITKIKSLLKDEIDILAIIEQTSDNASFLSFEKGSYFGCSSQGNCKNVTSPDFANPRTSFPVAVIEGDPIADFQRSIHFGHENNARFILYYSITKKIASCWEKGGMYDEGGNGDGTAMYYNPENGDPWPSVRMMHWHIAQQAVEKIITSKQL